MKIQHLIRSAHHQCHYIDYNLHERHNMIEKKLYRLH